MPRHDAPVSLADLSAAGVRLRPYEAVTLVRELVRQVAAGEVAGVPSSHVIRLSSSGAVSVEGPVAAGGASVTRAAQLLDSLLPVAEAGSEFRVPGGLKLVVARALGTLDLPRFASLPEFSDALARFGATDPAATVTNLVVSWTEFVASRAPSEDVGALVPATTAHVEPFVAPRTAVRSARVDAAPLTVSDIRRARRATGLPLKRVSERSRIPLPLLRQLEWGYLQNWPSGHYGRAQLVRYARATGLDEQLVVSTIEPLLEQAADTSRQALVLQPPAAAALQRTVTAGDAEIVPAAAVVRVPAASADEAGSRRRTRILAALAIPALLAVGLLPAWWAISSDRSPAVPSQSAASTPPANSNGSPAGQAGRVAERAAAPDAAGAIGAVPTAGRGLRSPDRATPAPQAAMQPQKAAYTLAADGGSYSPSFASVGTAMFYHAKEDGSATLLRADTDSHGSVLRITRIVDDKANNFHVRPSPDGTRIAFDSDRDGERGVYLADADGRNVRRVSPEGFAAVPSWSPDGTTLAFVRAEADTPDVWNLWTLVLETGELRQITSHRVGQPWGGSWFPDGRRIAYSHEDRLVIHDLQTGDERVFRTPRRGHLVRTPAVSPDGRRIIFQVHRDGGWLLDVRNGSMRKVLEDATAEEYTWAPDGRRFAYHSRKSGTWNVWVRTSRQ